MINYLPHFAPKGYKGSAYAERMVIFLTETRRRDRESFEVLLRRFFRDVQQSGVLTEAKKRRFFEKDISRKIKRASAQRKADRKRSLRGY